MIGLLLFLPAAGCGNSQTREEQPVHTRKATTGQPKAIPHLTTGELQARLIQARGFQFTQKSKPSFPACIHGTAVDAGTGIKFGCDIYAASADSIQLVRFTVDGSQAGNRVSTTKFNTIARSFLHDIAGLTTDNPGRAAIEQWLAASVRWADKPIVVFKKTVEQVEYELRGSSGRRTLELKPAK